MPLRHPHTEDEVDDFNQLEREILILIAKWTEPDHPEGRHSRYHQFPQEQFPQEIEEEFIKVTSGLFAIIETINDPKDPIWETNPHPYS
jgi:hypothetical protein